MTRMEHRQILNGVITAAQNWTSKAGYSNWKTDYLWLPSVAEVGFGDGTEGIWATSIEQRKSSRSSCTLRSAHAGNSFEVNVIVKNGMHSCYIADGPVAIRPAFHLNLSKADAQSSKGGQYS